MYKDSNGSLRMTGEESRLALADQVKLVRDRIEAMKASHVVTRCSTPSAAADAASRYFDETREGRAITAAVPMFQQ